MELKIKARLKWVQLYEETGDAGFVCRRCGISRPTLRKWSRRFKELGIEGLRSRSRRPHGSLKGQTPMEKACDLLKKTPYWTDVYETYDPRNEDVQERNYRLEMKLRKLKRSM